MVGGQNGSGQNGSGQNGTRTKWYEDKMVLGQNGRGHLGEYL